MLGKYWKGLIDEWFLVGRMAIESQQHNMFFQMFWVKSCLVQKLKISANHQLALCLKEHRIHNYNNYNLN
jgi:hypothetical protein